MNAKNESHSETKTALEVFTFNYSESNNPVRTLLVEGEVYFVGSDVAKTLGYKEPHKAIRRNCRYGMKRPIPHPQSPEKTLKVLTIPEGDVFRLIINSELPSAQVFESWVMDELLPTLRKKGYYGSTNPKDKGDFIDARATPYGVREFNGFDVRYIKIDGEVWFSINDIHRSIGSSTSSNQSVKQLNAKKTLARKILLFGNTNPAWFTTNLGFQLLLSGSRILRNANQLKLQLS